MQKTFCDVCRTEITDENVMPTDLFFINNGSTFRMKTQPTYRDQAMDICSGCFHRALEKWQQEGLDTYVDITPEVKQNV